MHQLELEAMRRRNGVYVLGDTDHLYHTMAVVVSGADEERGIPGQMHSLIMGNPCPENADEWTETATLYGGPYSAKACEEATRDDEMKELELELRDSELATWKGIVGNCLPILRFALDFLNFIGSKQAAEAKATLDRIEEMRMAEKITSQIKKDATKCM